jgi:hypothetical protein
MAAVRQAVTAALAIALLGPRAAAAAAPPAAAVPPPPAAAPSPPPPAAPTPAGDCFDHGTAEGAGPLPTGVGPADFGAVPESCPGFDLAVRARATLLVASDAPDYFGLATASAMFRLRYPLGAATWLSVAFDAITYRFAANATVQSGGLGIGPPTVGVYRRVSGHDQAGALAVYARALLPFDTARGNSHVAGLEAGASGRLRLSPRAGLQGGLSLAAPADFISGQVHAQLDPGALAELWLAPRRWIALTGGAAARLRAAPDPRFLALEARAGVRMVRASGLSFAAIVELPFAGSDRTDFVASLFVGWSPAGDHRAHP